ncbi:hypothetical protein BJ878DRAFT_212749 [Calycina marina]|uniref:Uncharacterized protein n=1 Tax=Calycina marina TaxID=1763456 RepID=A0A9P7YXN5_9HELO|nr:hypothetical protein BJ878DRAFT_212749 [Calycina marina]
MIFIFALRSTMSEIKHNPPPTALPILGLALLQKELQAKSRFANYGDRICTGCADIDDHVLGGGGFERGIVVGVNGLDDIGRLIAYNAVASVALSNLTSSTPTRKALIIDISGNFSVQLLSHIIRSRLLSSKLLDPSLAPEKLEEQVISCLETIDIDTVFDITGLWEVLGSLSGGSAKVSEMEIVFIDNLGVLISSLLSDKTEAYDLLSTLCKSNSSPILLTLVALTHQAKTLIRLAHDLNILFILRVVASTSTYAHEKTNPPYLTSIFASNAIAPALGRTFDQFVELHVLVGCVGDAGENPVTVIEVLKDEAPDLGAERRGLGSREQRWAPVAVAAGEMVLVGMLMEGDG